MQWPIIVQGREVNEEKVRGVHLGELLKDFRLFGEEFPLFNEAWYTMNSHTDRSRTFFYLLTILVGSVWVFHGLYSKLLSGIPRHHLIVERILGDRIADFATPAIGFGEIALGLWAFTRRYRPACALAQTLAIAAMNFLEILLARDLLISAPGMVALNLAFLSLVWYWAFFPSKLTP